MNAYLQDNIAYSVVLILSPSSAHRAAATITAAAIRRAVVANGGRELFPNSAQLLVELPPSRRRSGSAYREFEPFRRAGDYGQPRPVVEPDSVSRSGGNTLNALAI